MKIKADLHVHGPIGFQPRWLKLQGYRGKNLLKEIADKCFDGNINVCAITSDEDKIPKGSVHDRFGQLKEVYSRDLPEQYETDTLGDNVLIVSRKHGGKVYIVNSQTVRIKKEGKGHIDHLVIGSNQILNGKNLDYTLKNIQQEGLISIAEHPLCVAHRGIGREKLEEILPYIHAIEGHNSQLIIASLFSKLPVFRGYKKNINEMTQKFARKHGKPWISTSDAHRIEDIGISYIEFDSRFFNTASGERFLESLKSIIRAGDFKNNSDYENPIDWIKWVSLFICGTKIKRIN